MFLLFPARPTACHVLHRASRFHVGAAEMESLHYLAIILINRFEDIETDLWNREGETINELERQLPAALCRRTWILTQLADQFHLSAVHRSASFWKARGAN